MLSPDIVVPISGMLMVASLGLGALKNCVSVDRGDHFTLRPPRRANARIPAKTHAMPTPMPRPAGMLCKATPSAVPTATPSATMTPVENPSCCIALTVRFVKRRLPAAKFALVARHQRASNDYASSLGKENALRNARR